MSEDNTSADFITDRGETVVQFRASGPDIAKRVRVRDDCDFVGKLYHFSGKDNRRVSVRIDTEEFGSVSGVVSESVARELRNHTLDFVRLIGSGDWTKVGDGPWLVSNFEIERFELVKETSLKSAVDDIRKLDVNWEAEPIGFVRGLEDDGGLGQ